MTKQIDSRGAVDLDAVKLRKTQEETAAKLAAEKRQADEQAAVQAHALAWEKAMKRAFKGIFPHKTRMRFLNDSSYDDE